MMLVNIALAIVTLLAYGAYYFHPATFSILPIIAFIFPFLLIGNFLFLCYWGYAKPKKMLLSLLILLLGLPHLKSYLGSPFKTQNDTSVNQEVLNVMTYNIRNFEFKQNIEKAGSKFANWKKTNSDIDILCVQEHQIAAEKMISEWAQFPNQVWIRPSGTAIYAKYPIKDSGKLNIGTTGNSITWADIDIRGIITRCFCAHLESNKISAQTEKISENSSKDELFDTSKSLYRNYSKSVLRRIEQTEKMLDKADDFEGPIIIMGDFNDVPLSYTYQKVSKQYDDTFVNAGKGILSTYRASFPGIRIDYIFHSDHFKTLTYDVIKMGISDHLPVKSRLMIKDK